MKLRITKIVYEIETDKTIIETEIDLDLIKGESIDDFLARAKAQMNAHFIEEQVKSKF